MTDTHSISSMIKYMTNVEMINLHYVSFNNISKSITKLSNLRKLNYIDVDENIQIPKHIFKLTNLQELSLGFRIEKLPKYIGNLTNLVYLDISGNNITKLPKSIQNLQKLEKIDLKYTQINYVPKSFSKLTNLRYLEVDSNDTPYWIKLLKKFNMNNVIIHENIFP
jgi:Leucine-rich repeat (LRR) protein